MRPGEGELRPLVNASYSVPALWIISPAKSATTSTVTALMSNFKDWDNPHKQNSHGESSNLWATFIRDKYFNNQFVTLSKQQQNYEQLRMYLDNISICTLHQYPFFDLLVSIDPNIIDLIQERIVTLQNPLFSYGIKTSQNADHFVSVIKSPQIFYSPFTSIILAHYLSPIDFKSNRYGTKILITIRHPIARVISWYSMIYLKLMKPPHLIEYQIVNVSLLYKPLNDFRQMIVNRDNECDDVLILNEFFKWYLKFYLLIEKCRDIPTKSIANECTAIQSDMFSRRMWHHPIHMIFSGFLYQHLLLYLNVYKQQHLLGIQLKLMSFRYLITNSTKALTLIKCWTKAKYDCSKAQIIEHYGNETKLHRSNSATKQLPKEVINKLTQYFKPLIIQTNSLLYRYNQDDDIFLGDLISLKY